eukprot:323546-Amphidinium_carterae.1
MPRSTSKVGSSMLRPQKSGCAEANVVETRLRLKEVTKVWVLQKRGWFQSAGLSSRGGPGRRQHVTLRRRHPQAKQQVMVGQCYNLKTRVFRVTLQRGAKQTCAQHGVLQTWPTPQHEFSKFQFTLV